MPSISVNASAPFMDRLVDFVFTRNSIYPDQHPIFKVSALPVPELLQRLTVYGKILLKEGPQSPLIEIGNEPE